MTARDINRTMTHGLVSAAILLLPCVCAAQTLSVPADQPVARTDANSQRAHQDLLAKAGRGRIDVYFVGDSITRRWGALDYPELLANWTANFFGWNAAKFGWGGDTTQNILWRLQNGELEGLHPKVIVLLAGTNNVGAAARPGGRADDDANAANISRGLAAVVDVLRAKAPAATIVVTAIFPRGDNPSLNATIAKVNRRIAALADGGRTLFVDVTDRLTDATGALADGMTGDGLHPTVKGYQVWADALKPILTRLLGAPADHDEAPPATGDPSRR